MTYKEAFNILPQSAPYDLDPKVREAYARAIDALMFFTIREENIQITASILTGFESGPIFNKAGATFIVTQLREPTVMDAAGTHMNFQEAEHMYGPFFKYPSMLHEGSGLFGGMHR